MSDSGPEPSNVGPVAGGNLRASDADREQVATVLNTAYAEGRLTRDEHDERLSQLMAAKTFDDLIPITRDLVVVGSRAVTPTSGPSSFNIDTTAATEEPNRPVAIFSGVSRSGKWRVRGKNQALALFGGIDVDLRDAIFEGSTIEISGICCSARSTSRCHQELRCATRWSGSSETQLSKTWAIRSRRLPPW